MPEQARLNDMGAERELALLDKIDCLIKGIKAAIGHADYPRRYRGGFRYSGGWCEHGLRFDMPCKKCLDAPLITLLPKKDRPS